MSPLDLAPADPLAYFAQLVRSDQAFPLLEAASCIAQHRQGAGDPQGVLHQLDEWQARLMRRVPPGAQTLERVALLNTYFYGDLGFAGNANNYFDPANSDLPQLIRSRRGIPISVAVLWLELASGIGLSAHGVSFPGHFLLRVDAEEGSVIQDPLDGRALSREELYERLELHHGARIAAWPLSVFLQAAPPREIVARMLRNLKEIYRAAQDWVHLVAVLDRALVLNPDAWSEWRDRGEAHGRLGLLRLALRDLETYVAHAPDDAQDIESVTLRIARLRHQL